MLNRKYTGFSVLIIATLAAVLGCMMGQTSKNDASGQAAPPGAGGPPSSRASLTDPTGTVSNPYSYFPGTEELGPEEIRVVACGTGMPAARRGQAASCFLIELGNGDKFLFDIGTGSMGNIMSLNIPADFLRKIFLSHLHTDHWGDLDNI